MHEMDLIPGDYRQHRSLQRSVRLFLIACTVVLCSIGLAKGLLTYLTWRENVQLVKIEQQQQAWEQTKFKTDSFRQQMQVAQQQLSALDELRGRDRVPLFLQAIDQSVSEGIWFDGVHFMRSQGTGTLDNVPGAANAGILVVPNGAESRRILEINQGVEIVGHALNHSLLAEFMRQLGAQPSVADLRLVDTGTRNYTTLQVVDFKLTLQVKKVPGSP